MGYGFELAIESNETTKNSEAAYIEARLSDGAEISIHWYQSLTVPYEYANLVPYSETVAFVLYDPVYGLSGKGRRVAVERFQTPAPGRGPLDAECDPEKKENEESFEVGFGLWKPLTKEIAKDLVITEFGDRTGYDDDGCPCRIATAELRADGERIKLKIADEALESVSVL